MNPGTTSLSIMIIYLLLVLSIGYWAWRRTISTREDYFMASRGLPTFVLLCALFGTSMSAFVMLGGPGIAYRAGYAAFGFVGGLPIISPIMMYLTGYRLWAVSKRYGYVTPGEAMGDRFSSTAVTWLLFIMAVYYLIPYLEISAIGGGLVFEGMTNKLVPYWLGAAISLLVVLGYVWFGGMRGTAWTNVFQTLVFVAFLVFALFFIASRLGGFADATALVSVKKLWIAGKGPFVWQKWLTFTIFVSGFVLCAMPHMQMRYMAAADDFAIKRQMVIYSTAIAVVWFPAIIIGTWGSGVFPGLVGDQSDKILPMMMSKFAPIWAMGILGAGMLAAMMSTMDAQLHTTGTMITVDVIKKVKPDISEVKEVTISKAFLVVLCLITFILALFKTATILRIAEISFSGFACMVPAFIGAQWWKRCSKWGVLSSLVGGFIALQLYFFVFPNALSWATLGGFLPVIPGLFISVVLLIVVSLLTEPPTDKVKKWWDVIDKIEASG